MSTINRSVVKNGLILYFDAANVNSFVSGSTRLNNLANNTVTGSLINGPVFNPASKGSITFDGTNDYIDLSRHYFPSNIPSFPLLSNNLTLCAWIKKESC